MLTVIYTSTLCLIAHHLRYAHTNTSKVSFPILFETPVRGDINKDIAITLFTGLFL